MDKRYCPVKNKAAWHLPVDFFARRRHFVDHLMPIWTELPDELRGRFYVPACLQEYAKATGPGEEVIPLLPTNPRSELIVAVPGNGPVVTCAYGDMQMAWERNVRRPLILAEHGVGLTFNHPGYAGGEGLRARVHLFLAPNEYIRRKTFKTFPNAPQVVIGTPKLDEWAGRAAKQADEPLTVAVAFHWDGSAVAPEAGNAWAHYKDALAEQLAGYKVLGHGHPKILDKLAPLYEAMGFEVVWDFREVLERADVYVNDCSSTMYEFCVTGRPVVVLNAPWFRREVKFGLRFWDYSDLGPQVEEPGELAAAIEEAVSDPGGVYAARRAQAVVDLYPHLGGSAERAGQAISDFVKGMRDYGH